ncbi:MAG TPA: hypothetical protein VJ652_20595 [Noviherbaspirillum sp.]|nr:hypothetical protein [Noviherbaspirillum sp.]
MAGYNSRMAVPDNGVARLRAYNPRLFILLLKGAILMLTQAAQQALSILRDGNQYQWYVVPLLVLVLYVYSVEVERRNWSLVLAGLAFWGMDWINEIINSAILHISGYAPVWGAPGKTAYLVMVGLNIEICFMFAILGIVACKMLPKERNLRILGMPNRLFFALLGSIVCVLVEYQLNAIGVLTWDYSWWNRGTPWLIVLLGYSTFFLVCYFVYDLESRKQQLKVLGAVYGTAGAGMLALGGGLGWL